MDKPSPPRRGNDRRIAPLLTRFADLLGHRRGETIELMWRQRHIGPALVTLKLVLLEKRLPFGGKLHQRQRAVWLLHVGDQLEAKPLAHIFGDRLNAGKRAAGFGDALQNKWQVADGHLLFQQEPQH